MDDPYRSAVRMALVGAIFLAIGGQPLAAVLWAVPAALWLLTER